MAINTDTAYGTSGLVGEREGSHHHHHHSDFHDTEKLLSSTTTEPCAGGQSNLHPSDTFTLNIRGSVRSLDAEQTGHRAPLKSGSVGHLAAAAPRRSASRLSLGPPLSPVPPGTEPPPSYLWLAVLACFCVGGMPFNICALWYAHVSRSILLTGDVQAATKYGRRAMLLSCIAILTGVAVIVFVVLTIEMQ